MEANDGALEKKGKDEVVVSISCSEDERKEQLGLSVNPNPELTEVKDVALKVQVPNLGSSSLQPGSTEPSQTPSGKPPTISTGTLTRRISSLTRSAYSKPKSRFVEQSYPNKAELAEIKSQLKNASSPSRNSPSVASPGIRIGSATLKENVKTSPATPGTPIPVSLGGGNEDEDEEEVYKTANLEVQKMSGKNFKKMVLVEWIVFICIAGFLIASLTVHELKPKMIWGLKLWKWCVLVLVIFCGRLVTEWLINILVFMIERNFLLKKKVLYFVYGLKKSVQVFIWLGLVLLAWALLVNLGVKRSRHTTKILNYITRALASCLIASAIWLVKTLLIKLLASSFQCTRFFDRIQESFFHQYIVRSLSGPPFMEMEESVGNSKSNSRLSFKTSKDGSKQEKEEVIDMDKLHRINQEKVSAWTMKGLIDVISGSRLSMGELNHGDDDEEGEKQQTEISSEWGAKAAAYQIFRNVAKPGYKYIEEEDLLRFMKKADVDNVLLLFEGAAETRKITRSLLKKWLVKVYEERKSLAHSLNDTKTAIEELNRLASGVVFIVIIIVWLLAMGLLTTQVLLFISSQLLVVVFVFGNTAKAVFEAIIFVFVMHPFDVGDRCVIDGVQMVVEEMNILTTVFLRYDNEKIYYPNSVLATKPISNFYRSPEMSDSVEFAVDFSTSIESIGDMKAKIKAYLESKPQYWRPGHSVLVKEIEDVNKMKMGLYVTHTINFQKSGDRNSRRCELVLELKKIFEELGIKYRLLPQEIRLSNIGSPLASAAAGPT